MAKDTGHGASITFGTSALAYAWRKIGAVDQEGESVEDTDLSNATFKSYLPGDLPEPGEFEIEYCFNPKVDLPPLGTAETITITAPLADGQSAAADLEGSGFIRKRTAIPELTTNGLQIGKMTVAFSGAGGILPVLTPGS